MFVVSKTLLFPVVTALWVVADGTEKTNFLVYVHRRRQIIPEVW
jgi:hypothetical protein